MDLETDLEPRKEKLKRRSSILKMPVPTSPTERTVEITATTTTTRRLSRRVSFAERFHVQEFCTDEQRTTMWTDAYEQPAHVTYSSEESSAAGHRLLNTTCSLPADDDDGDVPQPYVVAPRKSFAPRTFTSSSGVIDTEVAKGYPPPFETRPICEADKENVVPRHPAVSGLTHGDRNDPLAADSVLQGVNAPRAGLDSSGAAGSALLSLFGPSEPLETPPFLRNLSDSAGMRRDYLQPDNYQTPTFLRTSSAPVLSSGGSATDLGPVVPGSLLDIIGGQAGPVATPPFLRDLTPIENTGRDRADERLLRLFGDNQLDTPLFLRQADRPEYPLDRSPWGGSEPAAGRAWTARGGVDCQEADDWLAYPKLSENGDRPVNQTLTVGVDMDITRDVCPENMTAMDPGDMDLTQAAPLDLPEKSASAVNTTRCGAADMELTEAVPRDLPVKPTSAVNTTRCGAADMELTEAVPRDLLVKSTSAVNTTRCGAADMELTEAVPRDLPVKPSSAANTTRCGAADMELTEAVPRDLPVKPTSAVNTTRCGAANMELTEAVPRDLPLKPTSAVNTTRCGAADMELTEAVPRDLPLKPTSAVNTTRCNAADMELTEAVPRDLPLKPTSAANTTRCGAADMELTEAVPRDLPLKPTSAVNTTSCGAADMELTEAVPRDLPLKPTSAANTTRCGAADMELTEAVPRDLPVKPTSAVNTTRCGAANMELTEALPRDLPLKPTSAVNTTRCGAADMELTEAVPRDLPLKPTLAVNTTRCGAADMELTEAVPRDLPVKPASAVNTTRCGAADMELTEAVPRDLPMKPTSAVNTTRCGAADMELTEAVPRDLPVKPTSAFNTTRCGAADTELTEAVPRDLPVKPTSAVNTTRCGAADMELTEAVPQDLPVKPTSAANTTRCNAADMELTEAVPRDLPVKPTSAVNTTRVGAADMELTEAVPRDLPVKPTSAVNTTRCGAADMELTEAVPRDLPVKPTSAVNTTRVGAADMELTEAVPRDLPVKPTSAANTTRCDAADMELTEAVPRDLPVKTASAVNTTRCGAADMELTEAVPRDLPVKPTSAVNTARCGAADMELTEAVPRDLPVKPTSAVNTTKCGAADMELTEAVPRDLPVKPTSAVNTTKCGAADMELTEAVPRDLPVKPTSAVNTTKCGAADMELTEAVPRDLPVKPTSAVNTTKCGAADMELTKALAQKQPIEKSALEVSNIFESHNASARSFTSNKTLLDSTVSAEHKRAHLENNNSIKAGDIKLSESVPRSLSEDSALAVDRTACSAADTKPEALPQQLSAGRSTLEEISGFNPHDVFTRSWSSNKKPTSFQKASAGGVRRCSGFPSTCTARSRMSEMSVSALDPSLIAPTDVCCDPECSAAGHHLTLGLTLGASCFGTVCDLTDLPEHPSELLEESEDFSAGNGSKVAAAPESPSSSERPDAAEGSQPAETEEGEESLDMSLRLEGSSVDTPTGSQNKSVAEAGSEPSLGGANYGLSFSSPGVDSSTDDGSAPPAANSATERGQTALNASRHVPCNDTISKQTLSSGECDVRLSQEPASRRPLFATSVSAAAPFVDDVCGRDVASGKPSVSVMDEDRAVTSDSVLSVAPTSSEPSSHTAPLPASSRPPATQPNSQPSPRSSSETLTDLQETTENDASAPGPAAAADGPVSPPQSGSGTPTPSPVSTENADDEAATTTAPSEEVELPGASTSRSQRHVEGEAAASGALKGHRRPPAISPRRTPPKRRRPNRLTPCQSPQKQLSPPQQQQSPQQQQQSPQQPQLSPQQLKLSPQQQQLSPQQQQLSSQQPQLSPQQLKLSPQQQQSPISADVEDKNLLTAGGGSALGGDSPEGVIPPKRGRHDAEAAVEICESPRSPKSPRLDNDTAVPPPDYQALSTTAQTESEGVNLACSSKRPDHASECGRGEALRDSAIIAAENNLKASESRVEASTVEAEDASQRSKRDENADTIPTSCTVASAVEDAGCSSAETHHRLRLSDIGSDRQRKVSGTDWKGLDTSRIPGSLLHDVSFPDVGLLDDVELADVSAVNNAQASNLRLQLSCSVNVSRSVTTEMPNYSVTSGANRADNTRDSVKNNTTLEFGNISARSYGASKRANRTADASLPHETSRTSSFRCRSSYNTSSGSVSRRSEPAPRHLVPPLHLEPVRLPDMRPYTQYLRKQLEAYREARVAAAASYLRPVEIDWSQIERARHDRLRQDTGRRSGRK